METLYITHPSCRLHDMGDWHPESPDRLDAISDQMLASGLAPYVHDFGNVAPVSREALLRVHTAEYLDHLEAVAPREGLYEIDGDTLMNPYTLEAAKHAAGAVVAAVDAVMQGEASQSFCAVRPPGHHALPNQAMGFCFYNNIGVAAAHAMAVYGVKRLAIIDFDVHHGNGTEAMFANVPEVLMCSFFSIHCFRIPVWIILPQYAERSSPCLHRWQSGARDCPRAVVTQTRGSSTRADSDLCRV